MPRRRIRAHVLLLVHAIPSAVVELEAYGTWAARSFDGAAHVLLRARLAQTVSPHPNPNPHNPTLNVSTSYLLMMTRMGNDDYARSPLHLLLPSLRSRVKAHGIA